MINANDPNKCLSCPHPSHDLLSLGSASAPSDGPSDTQEHATAPFFASRFPTGREDLATKGLSVSTIPPSLAYTLAKDVVKFAGKHLQANEKWTQHSLEQHSSWCEGWSRQIQMFGMTKPLRTDRNSISLSISDRPRKFFSPDQRGKGKELYSEDTIISDTHNYVILGDPGCGKTTLTKRLTRKIILEEEVNAEDNLEGAVIVLARDLHPGNSLFQRIAEILGIKYEPFDISKFKLDLEKIEDRENYNMTIRQLRSSWESSTNAEAKAVIKEAFRCRHLALLIDGIDEISGNYRNGFEHDLDEIANTCANLKIICTCRAGDWTKSISSLHVLAIESLSDEEVREIVELWASKPDEFMNAITAVPYKDVLDRPLFLTLLLIIFNQGYSLPDCPADVYERITWLLIDRWDRERDLARESKFSAFLSEKKLRFISSLAFELTFEYNKKRFSTRDLESLYAHLAKRFNLPTDEFDSVLSEIESHTGIIVESGFGHFEFCHLTVQEFLAAKYIVGQPDDDKLLTYLALSPATVAVAASLSTEPSAFLAKLVKTFADTQKRKLRIKQHGDFESLIPFVARLELELPELTISDNLAMAMVELWEATNLIAKAPKNLEILDDALDAVIRLTKFPVIISSLKMVFGRPGVDFTVISGEGVLKRQGKIHNFDYYFYNLIREAT